MAVLFDRLIDLRASEAKLPGRRSRAVRRPLRLLALLLTGP